MSELWHIQTLVFLILMLQFTAVSTKFSFITVRDGDDVTLSCQNEVNDHDKCSLTHWFFRGSRDSPVIDLVKSGQMDQTQLPRSRSDRLSVTEKCSLFIKSVTQEDVGQFFCRQRGRDSGFDLTVVALTEQKMDHGVTLSCVVQRTGKCEHTVKWLFKYQEVEGEHREFKTSETSQTPCFASVSVEESHYIYSSRFTAFQCEVTDPDGNKQKFSFRQSGGFEVDSKTTASPTTTKMYDAGNQKGWWRIIIVSVASTTLIVIVVVVNVWTRTKGNKRVRDENTLHDEDEDEGAVNYENVGVSSASV
ncbi:uncharacterized protein LOC114849732 [Betta splendens]|uniref:Uncharacterized protein LOC114849732 n=1 Tax=Betta splendens TaxID=158456 RepID=A0A8M1HA53_BETSP|nr:uncharacterized protein LOC114849732 [Betta splendens]